MEYFIHNLIGHPMMAIFNILGMRKAATWIHDSTLPRADQAPRDF